MTRERLIELWPVMEHFKNGGAVQYVDDGSALGWQDCHGECAFFNGTDYRIKPSPKLVPLEAEDWINGGPWWVRLDKNDVANLVVAVERDKVWWASEQGGEVSSTMATSIRLQRRSASDPEGKWTQCSKEATE